LVLRDGEPIGAALITQKGIKRKSKQNKQLFKKMSFNKT
jgi:hypothetical protein